MNDDVKIEKILDFFSQPLLRVCLVPAGRPSQLAQVAQRTLNFFWCATRAHRTLFMWVLGKRNSRTEDPHQLPGSLQRV